MVNKSSTRPSGSLTLSSGEQSRTGSFDGLGSSRSSNDLREADSRLSLSQHPQDATGFSTGKNFPEPSSSDGGPVETKEASRVKNPDPSLPETTPQPNASPRSSIDVPSSEPRGSKELGRSIVTASESGGIAEVASVPNSTATTPQEYEALIAQMRSDYEISELRRQDETHSYIERIDALHAKLQYLSKETVESARKAASSAQAGSIDQKLSEKEEQVALLMDEGAKLSKAELHHLTTIKKLRAKAAEDEKRLLEARQRQEKAERDAVTAREEVKVSDAARRRMEDRIKMLSRIEKELEDLKAEKSMDHSKVSSLKAELTRATSRAEAAEERAHQKAQEVESKTIADLQEELSNTRLEKDLGQETLTAEIRNLKKNLDGEKERARLTEIELRGEYSVSCPNRVSIHGAQVVADARE